MIMAPNAVVDSRISELEFAFPKIDPHHEPCGSRVLVQLRRSMRVTTGGIILPNDTRDTERDNCQVAKVVALGPLAFKNRNTLETWNEGQWVQPGDFIRAPKYGGDRWNVQVGDEKGDDVTFVIIDDLNVVAKITGDPLAVKAFI